MKRRTRSILAALLAMLMLLGAMTLTSCKEPEATTGTTTTGNAAGTETPVPTMWADAKYTEDAEVGAGAKTFTLTVTADGESVVLTVHTDKDNLADALLEYGLVEGDDSQYGLYVKKVNGILADYSVDQHYWNLLENGKATSTGASGVSVTDGTNYEFKRIK